MNVSAFPGQTLAPIPLENPGLGPTDSGDTLLQKIAQILYNAFAAGGGGSGGIVITPQSVTPNFLLIAATGSGSIPINSKGYSITFLTGTGTVAGQAAPAGYSVGDVNTNLVAIAVTTDAASTAMITWNT